MSKQKETEIKAFDLSKILKPYENKWVALSPDRKQIIASGDTLEETASRVNNKVRERVAFSKILPLGSNIAPSIL